MKKYYRIMLGRQSIHAQECFSGTCIGADFGIEQDLAGKLPDEFRAFNREFIPVYQAEFPDKSKVAAGLAMGALWTVSMGVKQGDVILCPDGKGEYWVGEVNGDYYYSPGEYLPHRRPVTWYKQTINREQMSTALKGSTGSIGTVSHISKHCDEIEKLLGGIALPTLFSTDETVEDPTVFALETHLEDFLVKNWNQTPLGKHYDIYEADGEVVGQQFQTDTGHLDILAISKDKKELLVIELKKGRASDAVVGQIQRYMGYVLEVLAEKDQVVKGVIIALDDDIRIKRALVVANNIEFFRYIVSFDLVKDKS